MEGGKAKKPFPPSSHNYKCFNGKEKTSGDILLFLFKILIVKKQY